MWEESTADEKQSDWEPGRVEVLGSRIHLLCALTGFPGRMGIFTNLFMYPLSSLDMGVHAAEDFYPFS